MKQEEVKKLCTASMLRYDPAVLESLAVIESMMEEVVHSELCVSGNRSVICGESSLRSDEVKCDFTREEMLSGVEHRKSDFAVVPAVIK